MRIFDRSLALTCEHGEDRTRRRITLDAIEGFGHRILPKTLHGVMLEICCRRFVLRVLEATHSLERAKAFSRGTLEKVAQAIVMVLDEDVWLEEAIQRGTPGEFDPKTQVVSIGQDDGLAVLTKLLFKIGFGFLKFVVGELNDVRSRRIRVGIRWRGATEATVKLAAGLSLWERQEGRRWRRKRR